MTLTIILTIFFGLWLIYDFKRGVIMLTVWMLFLDVLSMFNGRFTVFRLLAVIACAIGVLHYFRHRKRNRVSYPFWVCAVAMSISYIMTNLFSMQHHWLWSLQNIAYVYVFPFFVWYALDEPRYMKKFVKYTFIFAVLIVAYAAYEEITRTNPIIEWLMRNGLTTSAVGEQTAIRFGLKRLQSFLTYSGALGVFSIINVLFFVYVNTKHKIYIQQYSRYIPYLVICLYLSAFFTGSRSIIFSAVVGSLYFVRWRIFKNRWTWIIIVATLFILPYVLPYLQEILSSFEDTEAIRGSSTEMRRGQFSIALYYMNKEFWFGNGIGYTFSYVVANFPDVIYGAESIWIPLMIDQGAIGILAYLVVLFVPVRYCIKLRNFVGLFIIIAFIAAKTMSSIPGVTATYFLIYVIATCRLIFYEKYRIGGFSHN